MAGKHDPGVDVERRAGADLANRIPQRVDLCDQQVRAAVEQVRREEERSARNPIATIIRHGGSMPSVGERRKALRFSALRRAAPSFCNKKTQLLHCSNFVRNS
jgi:hypothetical protein